MKINLSIILLLNIINVIDCRKGLQSTVLVDSNYTNEKQHEEQEEELIKELQSHLDHLDNPDRIEDPYNNGYRFSYDEEDYAIGLLVNPCGVNDTRVGYERPIPLGYDCCMNRFGMGEYGFHKYIDGKLASKSEILKKRLPTGPMEVQHNMLEVDEHGFPIPFENSRRADDHIYIDDSCIDLRDPHPSCIRKRFRAVRSNRVAPCSDHNQTVDASLPCRNPNNGSMSHNCMQMSYTQSAFIHICGEAYQDQSRCGTYIEIHQPGGNQYDSEDTMLAETKITTRSTNGMITTTIPLTYKGDKNRILCSYNNSKIRVGSMVRIKDDTPSCCCPRLYNKKTKQGSIFCPQKAGTRHGPFADSYDTLMEHVQLDTDQDVYPVCEDMRKADKDMLMCSKDIGRGIDSNIVKAVLGSTKGFFHTTPCDTLEWNETKRTFTSLDVDGEYAAVCPLGKTFQSCGLLNRKKCLGRDRLFNFHGAIGKVTRVPDALNRDYGVTFNDGRTVYDFPEHQMELQYPESNYELWFVIRNRFERILQKKKGFRVIWPQCTFDISTNQYFPWTELNRS